MFNDQKRHPRVTWYVFRGIREWREIGGRMRGECRWKRKTGFAAKYHEGAINDPLFPAKSLDDVIDNYEMIREA